MGGCLIGIVVALLWSRYKSPEGTTEKNTRASAWYALLVLLYVGLLFAADLSFKLDNPKAGFGITALLILLWSPWLVIRSVLLRLGLVRLTYYLSRLANHTWGKDPGGGALAAAILARRQRTQPQPKLDQWLHVKLDRLRVFRGGGALACALLTDLEGRTEAARAQMRAVGDFDRRICPRKAYVWASEWLMLEAASRGAWSEVEDLQPRWWRRSCITALLTALARRLQGHQDAPSDQSLKIRWLLAGRWRATRAWVRQACQVDTTSTVRDATSAAPETSKTRTSKTSSAADDPIAVALDLHLRWLRSEFTVLPPHQRQIAFSHLGWAWQEALDSPEFKRRIELRAAAASTRFAQPEQIRRAFAQTVESELRDLITRGVGTGDEGESPLLARASLSEMETGLSRLQLAADSLKSRLTGSQDTTWAREFTEWCAVRQLYEQVAGIRGLESRRAAQDAAESRVISFAVDLFNNQQQRPLANAVFTWLLGEAKSTDRNWNTDLLKKNIRAGI